MHVIFSVGPCRLVYAWIVTYVDSQQGHVIYILLYIAKQRFSMQFSLSFPILRALAKTVHFQFSYPTSIAYIKPPLKIVQLMPILMLQSGDTQGFASSHFWILWSYNPVAVRKLGSGLASMNIRPIIFSINITLNISSLIFQLQLYISF